MLRACCCVISSSVSVASFPSVCVQTWRLAMEMAVQVPSQRLDIVCWFVIFAWFQLRTVIRRALEASSDSVAATLMFGWQLFAIQLLPGAPMSSVELFQVPWCSRELQNLYFWVQNRHICDRTFMSASRALICPLRAFTARSRASLAGPEHSFWVQNLYFWSRSFTSATEPSFRRPAL